MLVLVPIIVSPIYAKWFILVLLPILEFLISTKLPTLTFLPN